MPERAVVWVASNQTPPSALLDALSAKGGAVSVVGSAPAVITELACDGVGQVVLMDPQKLPRACELVEAVRAYYPSVICLRCDTPVGAEQNDGPPVLTVINGELRHHAATDRAPRTPHDSSAGTLPRLVRSEDDAPPGSSPGTSPGTGPGTSSGKSADSDGSSDDDRLITDEELSMLLGPVPEQDEP